MKISDSTIDVLADIITRFHSYSYRDEDKLMEFFYYFGSRDIDLSDFSSFKDYAIEKLKEYNTTKEMPDIIQEALCLFYFANKKINKTALATLKKHLKKDGYIIIPERTTYITNKAGESLNGSNLIRYYVQPIGNKTVETASIETLNHPFINEQIKKAKEKLAKDDYDGAITNARTLVEAFLKEIISKSGEEAPKWDGNLIKLYKAATKVLNLDPSKEGLEEIFKQMLSGLISVINGFSALSNEASDRHPRKYKLLHHQAKLAVNVVFTFCEFLLDHYEYQQTETKNEKETKTSHE